MGLKSFYYRQEEKYFRFLDRLEKKGVNLYKIVDPLEKNGIPTFLLFNLIILLLIIFLAYMFIGTTPLTDDTYTLTFVDSFNNPIASESLRISFEGSEKVLVTNEYGVVDVLGVKKTSQTLSINSDKYQIESSPLINFSESNNFNITLSQTTSILSKTIFFKSDNEVYSSPLTVSKISCSENENYVKNNLTTNDGSLTLTDIPSNCGFLEVSIESSTVNAVGSLKVDSDNQTGDVSLSFQDAKKGNATIKLLDKDLKVPISNLSVSIVTMQSQVVREGNTNDNGIVSFEDVTVGTYKIVVYDNDDRYKPISAIENIEITITDSTLETKDVFLEKAYIGHLKFRVIDSVSKEGIANVSTSLYKADSLIKTTPTDQDGLVTFGVEENISYKVVFNNPNYIIRTENNLRINDSIKPISLTPITNDNIRSLLVTVQDESMTPVDFATIRLWDESEKIILQTITADVYGKAVIRNLDPARTYKLDATKGKFTSGLTNPFMISEQEENLQTIKMVIGEGTFNLTLSTEFGESYQGNVLVYDASNDLLLEDKVTTTDQDGFTLIKIRADREVYFVVDDPDFKFITPRYNVNAQEIVTLNFSIPRSSTTSGIEFIGFYTKSGDVLNSVTPGEQVTARFILNVTRPFSKAVAHVRTGEVPSPACSSRSYNVSEDSSFIKEVRFAKSDVFGSLTYTPCTGQTNDLSNRTLKNAKWFNLSVNNPMIGSYLIEADVVVLETAFTNQPVNFRAEFYEGTNIIRSPIDSSLNSTASKQPLYAQTKQTQMFVGSHNQCTNLLCASYTIVNNQTNLLRNIVDRYNAEINNDYRLSFSLNLMDGKFAPDSRLVVTSGSSVLLEEYFINSVTGELLRGDDFSGIEIGNLQANDILSGDIDFRVIDDVSDVLNISLISNGQEVYSKDIFIDVKKAKEMHLEIVPRKIIPFVQNDVMLSITDDSNQSVSNANVNVLLNGNTIFTGLTNNQGLYNFLLPSPDLSDVLRIIVTKNEYRKKDFEIVIDDKLITPIPKEITFNLNSSIDIREVYNFSLLNESYVPLSITSVSLGSVSEFVDLDVLIEENTINGDTQNDISLTATLTEKGINLYTQKTIKTDLLIRLKNDEMNKNWIVTIPVTVRIVLGNSLDSLDCLKVLPVETVLRTKALQEATFDFTLENQCSSRNNPVDLGDINATLDWKNSQELGTFSLVVSGREYTLEDLQETQVLSSLLRGSKATVQLKFKAYKIASAIETPVITFSSLKGNINGVDEVKSTLFTEVIVNDYSQCLEIPQQTVPVSGCNWFAGYNMYNQYHQQNNFVQSYNINRQFNPHNQYQQGPGYFTQQQGYQNPNYNMIGQTGYVGQQNSTVNPYNFPTSQYQNQFGNYQSQFSNHNQFNNFMSGYPQGNYGNMGFSNNMNCPSRPIYIKNNCAEPLDVKLDPNYGINITSDSEFLINPGDTQEVLIMGGEEMGTFNIPVNAKPSLVSKETYSLVGNIPIMVNLPISFMPSKCIQVTPQKLDFSNILDPKYQMVKVMNTCFADGYRLVEVSYLDLMDLNFDGVSFLNVGEMEGRIQPIKVDYLTDLQTNKPIEVWEIALRRNPEIADTVSAKEYLNKYKQNSLAAGIISSFRKILIDVEDTINLKFVLQVGLQPPHGASSLIYNNVGMELKDNFQWLILDNQDNWGIFNDLFGQDLTGDEISFLDTSVELTYRLNAERNAVIIEVPESALTADKFEQINQDETVKRCFAGFVKDFPITGIKETSFIKADSLYYLPDTYTPLKVSIEFVTKNKNVFKLCFERPTGEINNALREDNRLKILDIFKEGNTDKMFELWAVNSETGRSNHEGHTSIGVDAIVSTKSIFDTSQDEDIDDVTLEGNECLLPDLSSKTGLTGTDSYKTVGLDKILFEYDSSKITETSCEEYYCDQEQFYDYLQKKASKLNISETSDYVEIDGIFFEKSGTTIKKSNVTIDLCANGVCDGFNVSGKEGLSDYIDQAKKLLQSVPEDLRKITIIKTKGLTAIDKKIVTLGGYQYTTVDYFLDNYNDVMNLSDAKKAEVYLNLEVYFGASPQTFVSNLKKFSKTNNSLNTDILNNYNTPLKTNKFSYSRYTDVAKPGKYIVAISKTNDKEFSITIGGLIENIKEDYKQNPLFYNPVNPSYLKSIGSISAPFIDLSYNKVNYNSSNIDIQKGYIFNLSPDTIVTTSGENQTDILKHQFIDSRPFYLNTGYDVKLIETSGNTEIFNYSNLDKMFLLKDSSGFSVYSNPVFSNFKNVNAFVKTNKIENNYVIYNINMNNVSPKLTYNTMKDVFNQINKQNVCFNIHDSEIKLWHNPDIFK